MREKKKKVTLSEKAYEYVRGKIVSGEFKEGEVITEASIGEELNMSRTPVKKAFTKLEVQNYVKSIDGIGTIVKGLSIKDLSDIYEARILIEVSSLKTAIKRINPTEAEKMMEKLQTFLKDVESGKEFSPDYTAQLDGEFHGLIINNTTNDYYKILMDQIKHQIERYQYEAYALTDTTIPTTKHHIEILSKIMEDDYNGAKDAITNHIKWSFRELSSALFNFEI